MSNQPLEDRNLPNPDYVEPKDGESCGIIMNHEGTFEGIYDKAQGKVVWNRLTWDDFHGDAPPQQ